MATSNNCDRMNGFCTNIIGSYNCSCNAGYTGDGINCSSNLSTVAIRFFQ